MKYPFQFATIKVDGAHEVLTTVLPQELSLVSEFLFCDVQSDWHGRCYLEKIDEVLRGTKSKQRIEGNVYEPEIRQDNTLLTNALLENTLQNHCEIETTELRELILLWLSEKKRRCSFSSQNRQVDSFSVWVQGKNESQAAFCSLAFTFFEIPARSAVFISSART